MSGMSEVTLKRWEKVRIYEPGENIRTIGSNCEVLIRGADLIALIDPEPRLLTLGELQEMDGQPVWVNVLVDDYPGEWALASEFCKGATTGTSVFQYDSYGVIWAAYDRPPGGEG